MAAQTFTTDTKTFNMRLIKWLFIGAGVIIVFGNGYKIINKSDPNYLNLVTGVCILFLGLFFDVYYKNTSLTIGDNGIRYHRFKTGLRPEEEHTYSWENIKKVTLGNHYIRLMKRNAATQKLRLPHYSKEQFQEIKQELRTLTEANGAAFEIKSRW